MDNDIIKVVLVGHDLQKQRIKHEGNKDQRTVDDGNSDFPVYYPFIKGNAIVALFFTLSLLKFM